MQFNATRPSEHYLVRPAEATWLSQEASFPLSAIDYTAPPIFNTWTFFFAGSNQQTIESLRRGLELTLEQTQWLAGSFSSDGQGGWVVRVDKGSSVSFFVDYLDGVESNFPSFDDLKNDHFCLLRPEVKEAVCISGMAGGTIAMLEENLKVFSVKATMIRGGFVLNLHTHHAAIDAKGIAIVFHQWATNTRTLAHSEARRGLFDPASIDRTVLLDHEATSLVDEAKDTSAELYGVSSQTIQDRKPLRQVLFYLSDMKAVELKTLMERDQSEPILLSTYDAFAAMWWHLLVKYRLALYNADPLARAYFAEAVDMRNRLSGSLSVPSTYHGNCWVIGTTENVAENVQLSLGQIASEPLLPDIAALVRRVTNSACQDTVQRTMEIIANSQDKASAGVNVAAAPPTSFLITDWRDMRVYEADFGFGKPQAFRGLIRSAWGPSVIVYETLTVNSEDQGLEFDVLVEDEILDAFLKDEEVVNWFEYRGIRI